MLGSGGGQESSPVRPPALIPLPAWLTVHPMLAPFTDWQLYVSQTPSLSISSPHRTPAAYPQDLNRLSAMFAHYAATTGITTANNQVRDLL